MSKETTGGALQGAMKALLAVATVCLLATALGAQTVPPADSVERSINAIGYQVGGGSTTVDLKSTGVLAKVSGKAKVEAKTGATTVEAEIKDLTSPAPLGSEFLTYVLWAVSPEGRAVNLGEVRYDGGSSKLKVTTQLQSFSLFVTAEPYYAVRQPSEVVVLENALRKNTKGKIYPVKGYQLMKRSQYQKLGNPLDLTLDLKKVPLEMYEARNAVEIARSRGADRYAPDVFLKAESGLKLAENAVAAKSNRKEIISLARQAAQASEDARALTAERVEAERIVAEREAAAATARAQAEAKAAAEAAEAKRIADLEASRQAELAAARQAQLRAEAAAESRRQADLAAAKEAQARAEADRAKQAAEAESRRQAELAAARQAQLRAEAAAKEAQLRAEANIADARAKAEADALRVREEAAKAEADRSRRDAEQLRAQLLDQFNRILETRDTLRGLVITMADVLFDTGKYDVRPATREHLAKLSGILLAHPGLHLEVEGHTDSTGSDATNQKLSEQRAAAVRDYLVGQGLAAETITAKGLGETIPLVSNDTAAGRQKNRRVELVVSGEVIGVKIGQ